ncbi:MAG: hypothetical protein KHX01_02745 [Eggerthella sp.]|nr:hypothetical protein [Eggerthella sp.]
MGLIDLASSKSMWRGLDYYQNGNVVDVHSIEDSRYAAKVRNNADTVYDVIVDLDKVRNSQCSCPFKKDKPKAICKHIVAAYFTIFPKEADDLQRAYEEWEAGAEEREAQHLKELEEYVNSLSIEDLRSMVFDHILEQERYGNYYW